MKKQRDWMQLLTNLAIVFGILLLIYELNQSRDLTRVQVVDSLYSAAVSRNLTLMGESPEVAIAKSLFEPDQLTQSDAVILSQYYTALMVSWLRNKDERGIGYFERSFEEVIASEAYSLNTEPGRKWWSTIRAYTDPEIVAAVDRELAKVTVAEQRQVIEQLVGEAYR